MPSPKAPPERHIVAINCHPFHPVDRTRVTLATVHKATLFFRKARPDHIDVILFWHGAAPPPQDVQDDVTQYGFALQHHPHTGNGANLNRQIEHAIEQGYALFFRVDGDDSVFSDRFILQRDHMQANGCDICGAGLTYQTDGERPIRVLPPALPDMRAYVENRFILHPSMAFRVRSFARAGLRYWTNRLEDKALIRSALRAGLTIENIQATAGGYWLGKGARNSIAIKCLGLRLTLGCLRDHGAYRLMPYALLLFAGQVCLGTHRMRRLRHKLRGQHPAQSSSAPAHGEQKQHS